MNKYVVIQSRPSSNKPKSKKRRWMRRKPKTTAFGEQLKGAIKSVAFGSEINLVDEGDVHVMNDILKRRNEVRK